MPVKLLLRQWADWLGESCRLLYRRQAPCWLVPPTYWDHEPWQCSHCTATQSRGQLLLCGRGFWIYTWHCWLQMLAEWLNIMIYFRGWTPPFKGHKLWSEICSYNLCCKHFFCGKTSMLFLDQEHFNLFLPITSLFLNFIYSSNYLCQTKNRYKTLPHYKLESEAWKSQNI